VIEIEAPPPPPPNPPEPSWLNFIDAALRLTWPVLLVQFIALALLVLPEQGQEILRAATTGWNGVKFLAFSLFFSFVLWMLTRTIIGKNTRNPNHPILSGLLWVSDKLALSSLSHTLRRKITEINTENSYNLVNRNLRTSKRFTFSAIVSLFSLIFIGVYTTFNYHWSLVYLPLVGIGVAWILTRFKLSWSARYLTWIAVISTILLIGTILFTVYISLLVGPDGTLFLGLLPLTIVLLFITHLLYNARRPLIGGVSLVILLLIFSLFIPDYHLIRVSDGQGIPEIKPAADAARDWQKQNPGRVMIVVAAAGGGIRAAYWTASILGKIEDLYPAFGGQLFAISAVSGGALGAAAFDALLDSSRPKCKEVASYHDCLRKFLSYDFLSPVLASQLTGNLLRQFTPYKRWPLNDRATVLELGWESAWQSTFDRPIGTRFADQFGALWAGAYRPALLLNGTSAITGRRLVTSNLSLTNTEQEEIGNPTTLPVRLSTAVDNSTRFPLIEPAGGIPFPDTPAGPGNPGVKDYVVDGGYYDNYGAATLSDLLRQVPPDQRVIAIQITSDPLVTDRLNGRPSAFAKDKKACRYMHQPESTDARPLGDLDAVYSATMAARSRTGLSYATILRDRSNRLFEDPTDASRQVRWIHFGMPPIVLPLGWTLSPNNRRCIDDVLEDDPLKTEIARLVEELKNGS
jgi:hypothetical protein